MSKSFQQRCMLCGRVFEIEALSEIAPKDNFLDPPPKKSRAFCPLCDAKIKKEAEVTLKEPHHVNFWIWLEKTPSLNKSIV